MFFLGLFGYLVVSAWARLQQPSTTGASTFSQTNQFTQAGVQTSSTQKVSRAEVETTDDPSIGPANAPVTIVEFGDFECPFCRSSMPVVKDVLQKYNKKVRFIFRDFPNASLHPNAQNAALAAGCAQAQGKFWQYHDFLYINQEHLTVDDLHAYAAQVGVNTDEFDKCVVTHARSGEITKDYNDGVRFGVSGTPTWFFNGRRVEGALPYDIFVKIIDLAKKGKI